MHWDELERAHAHCAINRQELAESGKCGCFYCLKIFSPSRIMQWIMDDEGQDTTAICPFCTVDAVLGERSGYPIETDFLRRMQEYWFGGA